MTTVQEWLDYLKWQSESLQRERQINIRFLFGVCAVIIGAILMLFSGIFTMNEEKIILGFSGLFIFGILLHLVADNGDLIKSELWCVGSLMNDIMLETISTPNEIAEEYTRIIANPKKYKKNLK